MKTNRCEVRTKYGVANVWFDGRSWRWTLAGNEGCGCSSFIDALDKAENAVADVEVEQ